ncbi:MAG TPA: FAD binding domain-containing protein [Stellaceae bacterium]|nr:FAD binding domain-containing protein [Stellaceae bacterium]
MKAPAFDYVRPQSLDEAAALLGQDGEAQLLAGGQSLLAMMNLRLAAPDRLIDISRLPELAAIGEDADAVTLGACVTHAMIEDRRIPDPSRGLLPLAAATLAYRAVRTRGTIGGSLALADPAGEWPCVFAALDAEALLRSRSGRRRLSCAGFVTGIYETARAADEIVEAVRVPKLSAAARWGYVKLARKEGAFAAALAVAVADPAHGRYRLVLGAANGPPLPLERAAALLGEGCRDEDRYRRAVAEDLAGAADRHFDGFETKLHAAAALRALRQVSA